MTRIMNVDPEPHPNQFDGEVATQIVAPVEFTGAVQHELSAYDGVITHIECNEGSVVIRASLPAGNYAQFAEALVRLTRGLGTVERL